MKKKNKSLIKEAYGSYYELLKKYIDKEGCLDKNEVSVDDMAYLVQFLNSTSVDECGNREGLIKPTGLTLLIKDQFAIKAKKKNKAKVIKKGRLVALTNTEHLIAGNTTKTTPDEIFMVIKVTFCDVNQRNIYTIESLHHEVLDVLYEGITEIDMTPMEYVAKITKLFVILNKR